jgi:DNA-binding GntR family transcriptional regulator
MTIPGVAAIEPLGPASRKTYKLEIYEGLHELIQTLGLPPGERLVEHELSVRFGVSKTPVREALLLLERERLVSLVPHVGAHVTWLSLDEYEQLLFISDALEQSALPLVSAKLDEPTRAACRGYLDQLEEARKEGDSKRFGSLVKEYHVALFSVAGYPLLIEMIQQVQRLARRYSSAFVHQYPANWARELRVVRERFENIAHGDVAAAQAAVQEGHAELISFARERVAESDPLVTRYLADGAA